MKIMTQVQQPFNNNNQNDESEGCSNNTRRYVSYLVSNQNKYEKICSRY